MAFSWYKVYHGLPGNKKLKVVAHRCEEPVAVVIAVWVTLLDAASANTSARGYVPFFEGFEEELAMRLEISNKRVEKIWDVLGELDLVNEDNLIVNWDIAQGKGYVDLKPSTKRMRNKRKRDKEAKEGEVQTEQTVAPCDACDGKSDAKRHTCDEDKDLDLDSDQEEDIKKEEREKKKRETPNREEKQQEEEKEAERDTKPQASSPTRDGLSKVKSQKGLAKQTEDADLTFSELQLSDLLNDWNELVQPKLTPKSPPAYLTAKRTYLLTVAWEEIFNQDKDLFDYFLQRIAFSDHVFGGKKYDSFKIDLTWCLEEENIAQIMDGTLGGVMPPPLPKCYIPELQKQWGAFITHFREQKNAVWWIEKLELVGWDYPPESVHTITLCANTREARDIRVIKDEINAWWFDDSATALHPIHGVEIIHISEYQTQPTKKEASNG